MRTVAYAWSARVVEYFNLEEMLSHWRDKLRADLFAMFVLDQECFVKEARRLASSMLLLGSSYVICRTRIREIVNKSREISHALGEARVKEMLELFVLKYILTLAVEECACDHEMWMQMEEEVCKCIAMRRYADFERHRVVSDVLHLDVYLDDHVSDIRTHLSNACRTVEDCTELDAFNEAVSFVSTVMTEGASSEDIQTALDEFRDLDLDPEHILNLLILDHLLSTLSLAIDPKRRMAFRKYISQQLGISGSASFTLS